ncbi:winged helix-turn-helix domain-containing protein [Variovorax robiniae]|uniref:Winged helix-turn-helix domain-containing protein n=1 Tax=Variovorax robiniae TaxID=1836199 RepID=A0ABU8XCM7_9BURK
MAKSDDPSQTYVRFLNLVSAIKGLPDLDAVERRVLDVLGGIWATGAKVTVLEAMGLAHDASPATVHRRLKSLRERGLIDLKEDESDNRVKYVVPTNATRTYFAKLGQALNKAARKTTD